MKKIKIKKPVVIKGKHIEKDEVVEVHSVIATELIGRGKAVSLVDDKKSEPLSAPPKGKGKGKT